MHILPPFEFSAVDDNISYIVGVITNTAVVVGMSLDNETYHVSEDDGFTWVVIDGGQLNDLLADPG